MSVPPSIPPATRSTDPGATHRPRSARRLRIILLAIVGASCLAAAVFAAVLLWRLAPTLISAARATPTPVVAAPTTVSTAAVPTELSPAPDKAGPAEGGLTDPELKTQVWSTIESFYTNVRGCTDVSSGLIRVSLEPDANGSWEETWDVSACAESASLRIQFTVAPDGGIFYDITE